jgi:hypothetical protein
MGKKKKRNKITSIGGGINGLNHEAWEEFLRNGKTGLIEQIDGIIRLAEDNSIVDAILEGINELDEMTWQRGLLPFVRKKGTPGLFFVNGISILESLYSERIGDE